MPLSQDCNHDFIAAEEQDQAPVVSATRPPIQDLSTGLLKALVGGGRQSEVNETPVDALIILTYNAG